MAGDAAKVTINH